MEEKIDEILLSGEHRGKDGAEAMLCSQLAWWPVPHISQGTLGGKWRKHGTLWWLAREHCTGVRRCLIFQFGSCSFVIIIMIPVITSSISKVNIKNISFRNTELTLKAWHSQLKSTILNSNNNKKISMFCDSPFPPCWVPLLGTISVHEAQNHRQLFSWYKYFESWCW